MHNTNFVFCIWMVENGGLCLTGFAIKPKITVSLFVCLTYVLCCGLYGSGKSVRVRPSAAFSKPNDSWHTIKATATEFCFFFLCVSTYETQTFCESCEFKLNVYDFCILFHSRSRSYSCFFRNGVIMFFFLVVSLSLLLLLLNHIYIYIQQTILLDFVFVVTVSEFGAKVPL